METLLDREQMLDALWNYEQRIFTASLESAHAGRRLAHERFAEYGWDEDVEMRYNAMVTNMMMEEGSI